MSGECVKMNLVLEKKLFGNVHHITDPILTQSCLNRCQTDPLLFHYDDVIFTACLSSWPLYLFICYNMYDKHVCVLLTKIRPRCCRILNKKHFWYRIDINLPIICYIKTLGIASTNGSIHIIHIPRSNFYPRADRFTCQHMTKHWAGEASTVGINCGKWVPFPTTGLPPVLWMVGLAARIVQVV